MESELVVSEVTEPSLALSPDGSRLYFNVLGDLVCVSTEDGQAQVLTHGPAYDAWPTLAEDGRALYFVSDRDSYRVDLYRMDLESSRIERVLEFRSLGVRHLAVSPDGAWVLCLGGNSEFRGLGAYAHLGEPPSSIRWLPSSRWPCFLADGSLVVRQSDTDHDRLKWVRDGEAETLTTLESGTRMVWGGVGPSGRIAVLCTRQTQGELWDRQELSIRDLKTGRNLAEEDPIPSRRARVDSRPAIGHRKAYYPWKGEIRVFDFETEETSTLDWKARLPGVAVASGDQSLAKKGPKLSSPPSVRGIASWSPLVDGHGVVLSAFGDLWMSEPGKTPRRLTTTEALEDQPFVLGDGETVRFLRDRRVHDLSLTSGQVTDLEWRVPPGEWSASPSGSLILEGGGYKTLGRVELVDFDFSRKRRVPLMPRRTPIAWWLWAHYGTDDEVIFTAPVSGVGQGHVFSRKKDRVRILTHFERSVSRVVGSSDGRYIAALRDGRAWIAERQAESVLESELRALGEGADAVRFSPRGGYVVTRLGTTFRVFRCSDRTLVHAWSVTIPMPEPKSHQPWILKNVHIVDVEGARILRDQSISVRDGKIEAVGPELEPTGQVVVHDGKGCYALAGLMDMHVHGRDWLWEPLLAYGVTTIRDLGRDRHDALANQEAIQAGFKRGPDMILHGEMFEGVRPMHGDASFIIESESEASLLLSRHSVDGLHGLKVYPSLPRPLRVSLLEEAKAKGIPCSGHIDNLRMAVTSIQDGLDGMEHVPRTPMHRDVLGLMARSGVAWCPTLTVVGGADLFVREGGHGMDDPVFRAATSPFLLATAERNPRLQYASDSNLRALVEERVKMVATARDMGVPIWVGTDTPVTNCYPGLAVHWELELLVRGGMTPAQALAAATVVPADGLGLTDRGRLESGMIADMVLIRENPLEDIARTRDIVYVVRRGRLSTPLRILSGR